MFGGAVATYVTGLQGRADKQERELGDYKLYVAEHYASKEFLSDLKREITESVRDLGRRIDFHPKRDSRPKCTAAMLDRSTYNFAAVRSPA